MIFEKYEFDGFSEDKVKEIEIELRRLFDDDEFVLGTLNDLQDDNDIDTVLDFINRNKTKMSTQELYEQVIFLTMDMEREYRRKNGIVYEWDPD